jgi:TRAP-type mannitol/chloroaromatic compound transport system substrate-binding protein
MKRRDVLAASTATAAVAGLAAPAISQGLTEWNMVMPWPRNTPGVGVNAERFAQCVNDMSGGRLVIKLFAAGELVPPFEGLDAVSSGTADCGHAPPYFWVGKAPVLNYFTGIPFGFSANELAAWFQFGGALELWQEVYDEFNVVPFYAGSSGVQAGGWFREPIDGLADLQGLKFRIAGLGGEVMRRLGVNTVLIPPGEIAPAMLSGTVDAVEWIGPWNDRAFGLYQVANYYYNPSFHEPGPGLEIIVNKDRWGELTPDLQAIIRAAAAATAFETLADFTYHNIDSFQPLLEEHQIEARSWPADVVDAMARETWLVLEELAATDDHTRRVHESFMAFLKKCNHYAQSFDTASLQLRARAMELL